MSANTYGQFNGKHFIQQYDANLTSLLRTTTFGKAGSLQPALSPSAFMVDVCGRVYISGWGGGTNQSYHNGLDNLFGFPTSADAFQKTTDGSDFYLMVLSPNFGSLLFSTYYGGAQSQEHVDGGTSHFDPSGIVYQAACAGCGGFSDFPTTQTAYSRTNPGKRAYNTNVGGCNLGLFKFDMRTYLIKPDIKDTVLTVIAGKSLEYDFYGTDAGGDMMTLNIVGPLLNKIPNPATVSIISSNPGLLHARLNWQSLCEDYGQDTFVLEVTVLDGACPTPNEKTAKIKLVVVSERVDPPFPQCVRIINDNTLQIELTRGLPSQDFGKYLIKRGVNGASLNSYDSITNQFINEYLDVNSPDNTNNNYCYQFITLNTCSFPGDSSRIICSKALPDTSSIPPFNGIETEIITLKAYDTLFRVFTITDPDPLDSVFVKYSGSFIDGKNGNFSAVSGVGEGRFILSWVPDCSHINQDTLEIILSIRDNSCPAFKQGEKRILLLVTPMDQPLSPRINCPKRVSDDSVFLEWPTYPATRFTKEIYLYRKVNGVTSLIAVFSDPSTISYYDLFSLDPNKSTCYALSSSDVCGFFSDTGAFSCIESKPQPAPSLSMYNVTVANDKTIQLVWQSAAPDSFWRYFVYRKTGRLGFDYEKVAEFRNVNDTFLRMKKLKLMTTVIVTS